MPRTFTLAKTGEVVETDLTDEAAALACRSGKDDFGKMLADKFFRGTRLSPEQLGWLHKIGNNVVNETLQQIEQEDDGTVERNKALLAVFDRAAAGRKYPPKLTFISDDGVVEVRMSTQGQYAGTLWITNGVKHGSPAAKVYGTIKPPGVLTLNNPPAHVRDAVEGLLTDPAEYSQVYAVGCGTCPACGMATDDEMHPRCADEFNFA